MKNNLVLHFDINETILIGDEAGGDTREDCLNKILAKNAFVRLPPNYKKSDPLSKITPVEWWDGTPIHSGTKPPPPPLHTKWEWIPDCCPYYRTSYKSKAKTFTLRDGIGYRPMYHKMEQSLQIPKPTSMQTIDERLSKDGGKTHFLLPAFFHMLHTLENQKRNVHFVLRTFGNDLTNVANALTAFATGCHPNYPEFKKPEWILNPNNMFRGRWKYDEEMKEYIYELHKWTESEGTVVASGDEEVLNIIENQSICAIQDDYQFWSKHNQNPIAGKPVWVRSDLSGYHHIIFDDNIKNDSSDSIVGVRYQGQRNHFKDGTNDVSSFHSLDGDKVRNFHGKHLIRVPTIEPMLDIDWFWKQIEQSEKRVAKEKNNP